MGQRKRINVITENVKKCEKPKPQITIYKVLGVVSQLIWLPIAIPETDWRKQMCHLGKQLISNVDS